MKSLRTQNKSGKFHCVFWPSKRCWKRKAPDIRRFYSPSPHLLQTPESSGPVGGAGAPGAAAASASWFKHTSPHTHQHMHICTGNLLNPRSLSIFAAFRRTQKAEGNFETWPASVNRTALNHMAHEAIGPIDYWLSKVPNSHLKAPKTPTFSGDWGVQNKPLLEMLLKS